MHFSLDDRTCALSVGEFAGFTLGPRDAGQGGPSGLWRVQLGQEWHSRLRARTEAEMAEKNRGRTRADAAFEVPLTLPCIQRGWTFTLSGRIDQLITVFDLREADFSGGDGAPPSTKAQFPAEPSGTCLTNEPTGGGDGLPAEGPAKAGASPSTRPAARRGDRDRRLHPSDDAQHPEVSILVREIKSVSGPLPADESSLRADYPEYFLQAIAYATLLRTAPRSAGGRSAPDTASVPEESMPLDLGPSAATSLRAELVFVEIGTGITQAVALGADDETSFYAQLERLTEFLDLQIRARDRLRGLQFRPAFAKLRAGQETIQDELLTAFRGPARAPGDLAAQGFAFPPHDPAIVFFEAPTGYGKTGVLLEFALGQLRAGRFGRLLYLTGKSTGQLQVMRTLAGMCATGDGADRAQPAAGAGFAAASGAPTPVAAWQVRPKSEHCVNSVFHCIRVACPFLGDLESRWAQSGLARFYLFDNQPHDLESLRAAGRDARLCPYEITRAALPFNDVWVGDYNYVFAPDNRGIFFDRPGFAPERTLLVIDEAHNLPARVAEAHSHVARAGDAEFVLAELHRVRALSPLLLAWEHWTRLLAGLRHAEGLDLALEDDVRDAIERLAVLVASTPLDFAALGPHISEHLWETLALRDWLAGDFGGSANSKSPIANRQSQVASGKSPIANRQSQVASGKSPVANRESRIANRKSQTANPQSQIANRKSPVSNPQSPVPTLLWCPRAAELHFTCLDAAVLIGQTLRAFGGVILTSATLRPAEVFAANCGLDESPTELARPDAIAPPAALGKLSQRARKALKGLTSGAELLKVEEAQETAGPHLLHAAAPWRDDAYAVGVDIRVDTTFQHRMQFHAETAATVEALIGAARRAAEGRERPVDSSMSPPGFAGRISHSAVAVFFPSYAYADHIITALQTAGSAARIALQPRGADLAGQASWVEDSLAQADALFLVLGSSFAESIDLLGGRVTHAMVVGPALPEVNAIQRSRLAELERTGLSRTAAFHRVYQIPGMQKVNQALGRLVRAPGQKARVLLHCRRFAEASYAALLAAEYQQGQIIRSDEGLMRWLTG